jgi:hypothetical protein
VSPLVTLFILLVWRQYMIANVGGGRNCFHSKPVYWLVQCGVSVGNTGACAAAVETFRGTSTVFLMQWIYYAASLRSSLLGHEMEINPSRLVSSYGDDHLIHVARIIPFSIRARTEKQWPCQLVEFSFRSKWVRSVSLLVHFSSSLLRK